MRQRKVKNEAERLAQYAPYLVKNPAGLLGNWKSLFTQEGDLFLEVGCGKGQFITETAKRNPQRNYIAAEGHQTVLLRALEKAEKFQLQNIFFIGQYIQDITEYFEEDEVSGIYLNFSDPWPKDRHAKRRLTHNRYLSGYQRILKPDACIEFKSDNDALFAFTREQISGQERLHILELTEDLHHTGLAAKEITTEYEDRFAAAGKNINYCRAQVIKAPESVNL